MKKLLLSVLILFSAGNLFAQPHEWFWQYTQTFDDSTYFHHIFIDKVSKPGNIWQIGKPNKTSFTSAASAPAVMVTDTVNPYPVNDTSVFEIRNLAGYGFTYPHTGVLGGKYYIDSDSSDYGMIEFSIDNGRNWIDIINDTVYKNYMYWGADRPILRGKSNGWVSFGINLAPLAKHLGVNLGDTLVYRFSFISDSIQTNKDGLMYDDIYFIDYVEGIEGIGNGYRMNMYPNPADWELRIELMPAMQGTAYIEVISLTGQVLFRIDDYNMEAIRTEELVNGFYFLKYVDSRGTAVQRFMVLHK